MNRMTDLFSQAIALHRSGRIDEAEALYRSILDASPNHADSLNLLGVIAQQRGDYDRSVELIRSAIAVRFDQPAFHCNLAAAYRGLNRFDDAIKSAKAALALRSDQLESHLNLGLALQGAQRWPEAEAAFREISNRWPKDPRGPQSLGDCFRAQDRIPEA